MADDRLLAAARRAIALIREHVDAPLSVRLWDGSLEPLGRNPKEDLAIRIETPGVLPSLLRRLQLAGSLLKTSGNMDRLLDGIGVA